MGKLFHQCECALLIPALRLVLTQLLTEKNHENVLDTQLFMSYRARQHIANWWVNTKVQTACILRMTYIMDTMVTANTLSPPTTGSLATLGMTPYIL